MSNYDLIIERSGDHCHLSANDYGFLFPVNGCKQPAKARELSVPGEYTLDTRIGVGASKGKGELTVILPTRKHSVIELSRTQAIKLGIKDIVTGLTSDESVYEGDARNWAVLEMNGFMVSARVIVQKPHIHAPVDYSGEDLVDVVISGTNFRTVLYDVPVKRNKWLTRFFLHLDNDTYNGLTTMNQGDENFVGHFKT